VLFPKSSRFVDGSILNSEKLVAKHGARDYSVNGFPL